MADTDPVILVDADDVQIGTAGKLDAHRRGLRHRAISVLVRNTNGEFLLHRADGIGCPQCGLEVGAEGAALELVTDAPVR